jgi:hypothetical protein
MKNFLYDRSHKFDVFSTYEQQLLFLDFLRSQNIIEVTDDYEKSPSSWITVLQGTEA